MLVQGKPKTKSMLMSFKSLYGINKGVEKLSHRCLARTTI